jgi:F420H(2)-dependent quinone reductase
MEIDLLKRLDDQIRALLNRLRQLQSENEQLMQHLAEREQRCNEASARLREQKELRRQIKIRIEEIMACLDSLELRQITSGQGYGRSGRVVRAMRVDPLTEWLTTWWSAQHVFFYRLTGGFGPFDQSICILTTRGRRSGREIAKPLWYYRQDGRLYIVASYGGSDRPPAWYVNLRADPEVQVEVGWSRQRYRARTLDETEARPLWEEILRRNPVYSDYQRRTQRQIPIVELSPS